MFMCGKHKHDFNIYLCFNCNILIWTNIIVLICSISLQLEILFGKKYTSIYTY